MINKRITAYKYIHMRNEEKAHELCGCNTCFARKWCSSTADDCCEEFKHVLQMAEWKDEKEEERIAGVMRNLERGVRI